MSKGDTMQRIPWFVSNMTITPPFIEGLRNQHTIVFIREVGSDSVNQTSIDKAVGTLWQARLRQERISALPVDCKPATLNEGYAVQDAMAALVGQPMLRLEDRGHQCCRAEAYRRHGAAGRTIVCRLCLARRCQPAGGAVADARGRGGVRLSHGHAICRSGRLYMRMDEVLRRHCRSPSGDRDSRMLVSSRSTRSVRRRSLPTTRSPSWFVLGPKVADCGGARPRQPAGARLEERAGRGGRDGANALGDPSVGADLACQ